MGFGTHSKFKPVRKALGVKREKFLGAKGKGAQGAKVYENRRLNSCGDREAMPEIWVLGGHPRGSNVVKKIKTCKKSI